MPEVTSTSRNTKKGLGRKMDRTRGKASGKWGLGGGQARSGHPVQEREMGANAWTWWGHLTPTAKLIAKVATLRHTWVVRPNCIHFGALHSVGEIWRVIWRAPSFHSGCPVDDQGQHHRNKNCLERDAETILSRCFTDEQFEAQKSELHYSNSQLIKNRARI